LESEVARLNENHKRRLVAAFRHADALLNRGLDAVAPLRPGPFPRYVPDMSPSEVNCVAGYVDRIRNQIHGLMQRLELDIPAPTIASSWVLKTGLISLDIALEDLHPDQMKGYGEIDEETAKELTSTLQEIRKLLTQLSDLLAEAGGRGATEPDPSA
jgi:hypothetical protein